MTVALNTNFIPNYMISDVIITRFDSVVPSDMLLMTSVAATTPMQ
jgi:hypothetical protein